MWNLLLAGARDSHAFAVVVLLVGALVLVIVGGVGYLIWAALFDG